MPAQEREGKNRCHAFPCQLHCSADASRL